MKNELQSTSSTSRFFDFAKSLKFRIVGLWCLALMICSGCSGTAANQDQPAPHGGEVYPIPGNKGLIEVVRKSGKAPITAELSIYFYKNAFTPFESMPESAELYVDQKRKVPLEVDDDALVTPKGPVLFASVGDRNIEAVVIVELDGQTRKIRMSDR